VWPCGRFQAIFASELCHCPFADSSLLDMSLYKVRILLYKVTDRIALLILLVRWSPADVCIYQCRTAGFGG
jgi:hypothetical protein